MNRKTEYARHKREKKWWSAIRGRGADGAVCACLYTEMLGVEVVVLFLSGVSTVLRGNRRKSVFMEDLCGNIAYMNTRNTTQRIQSNAKLNKRVCLSCSEIIKLNKD